MQSMSLVAVTPYQLTKQTTYKLNLSRNQKYKPNKSAKPTKETQLNQFILTSKAQKQTLLTQ